MNRLPDQKELVSRIKEAYKNKGLTLNSVLAMMPESEVLSKSTCSKIFGKADSETFNYDYNTLSVLSKLLLSEDGIVEMLEARNKELEEQLEHEKKHYHEKLEKERKKYNEIIDFRTSRISKLDNLLDEARASNQKKDELIIKLIEKCENCVFHKKE